MPLMDTARVRPPWRAVDAPPAITAVDPATGVSLPPIDIRPAQVE